jgi:hypothetical protein
LLHVEHTDRRYDRAVVHMFGHRIFLSGQLPPVCSIQKVMRSVLLSLEQTRHFENPREQLQASNCKIALYNHTFVTDALEKRGDFRIGVSFRGVFHPIFCRTDQKLRKARLN